MSHVRGRDKATNTFYFECFDFSGNLFRREANFATAGDADKAAQQAERDMMATLTPLSRKKPKPPKFSLSDDELLAELGR